MGLPKKAKFVIIGAGIHGLSTAWNIGEQLRAKGHSVKENDIIVLDKSGVAAGRKIKARMDLNKAKKAGPTVTGDVQSPTKKPPSGGNNVARTAQGSSKKVQGAVSNTIKTSRIGVPNVILGTKTPSIISR